VFSLSLVLILSHEFSTRAARWRVSRPCLTCGRFFAFRLGSGHCRRRREEGRKGCLTVSVGQGKVGCQDKVPCDDPSPPHPQYKEHHFRYFFCLKSDSVTTTKSALSPTANVFSLPDVRRETVTLYSIFTSLQKHFPTSTML